jgi:ketosteroid isomerase-like protein
MSDAALQRLLDRAEISDLLLAFARALDTKDWDAYAATFAEDGEFRIFDQVRVGRDEIAAGPARDLTRFDRTQHFSTNHVIDVDGDRATAQSYMLAVHVPDASRPDEHADIGGTYRCECVRTGDGWRFARVEIEVWWTAGATFAIEHEPAAG